MAFYTSQRHDIHVIFKDLKSHTSLKLFALCGLTSSPTLIEIPPGHPLPRPESRGPGMSLGRRGVGVAWCPKFVGSGLLAAPSNP